MQCEHEQGQCHVNVSDSHERKIMVTYAFDRHLKSTPAPAKLPQLQIRFRPQTETRRVLADLGAGRGDFC